MAMMYSGNIEITANNEMTEKFRLARLERVIGYVQALADHCANPNVLAKVSKLHDHKGTITVHWDEQPTEDEKEMFTKAWMSGIGDGADNVEHEV